MLASVFLQAHFSRLWLHSVDLASSSQQLIVFDFFVGNGDRWELEVTINRVLSFFVFVVEFKFQWSIRILLKIVSDFLKVQQLTVTVQV